MTRCKEFFDNEPRVIILSDNSIDGKEIVTLPDTVADEVELLV